MRKSLHSLELIFCLIIILQNYKISALKCRMEEEPSEDELRKVIHTCVRKVFGNQSHEKSYTNQRDDNSGNSGYNTANNLSWSNSNKNHKNNDGSNAGGGGGGFDHEDYDRIRNREHLQMRPAYHKMFKKNSQNYFDNNYDHFNSNNNNNRQQQQHEQQQNDYLQYHQQQQQQQNQQPHNNNNNNNHYNQRHDNGMGMGMDYGINNSPVQYDMNLRSSSNGYNNNNNNNNMNDDSASDTYGNNGHNGQTNHNHNHNNWNYHLNNTNDRSKQNDKQRQRDGACIVHCFFDELKMLNNDEYPDKRKIIQVLTKDVKNNDLREFYTESVKECFHLIEIEKQHKDKCDFSKALINCMTEFAKVNCDDWDDSTIIF